MEAGDTGGSRVHCYKCAGKHDCLYESVGQQLRAIAQNDTCDKGSVCISLFHFGGRRRGMTAGPALPGGLTALKRSI